MQGMPGIERLAKRLGHDLARVHPPLLNLRQHLGALPLQFSRVKMRVLQEISEELQATLDILGQQRQRHRAPRATSAGLQARPQEVEFLGNRRCRALCRPLIQETSCHIGESGLLLWIEGRPHSEAHA